MPFKIVGATSNNVAEVDVNHAVAVNLPSDATKAGNVRILDSDGNPIDTTENGFLRVSSAMPIFFDQVDGTSVNTNLYSQAVSGMTIAQASGFWTLNAGGAVTANSYAIMQSIKVFPLFGTLPIIVSINAKITNLPEAGATCELGIGAATSTSAPTDGAFFRWTSGSFYCVVNNAGAESPVGPLSGAFTDATGETITMPPSTSGIHLFEIEMVEDRVLFHVDDVEVASISVQPGQAYPTSAGRQQLLARVYTGNGAVSLAPQLSVGQVNVIQEDLGATESMTEFLATVGRGAYQLAVSGFGQTANHTNSTSPVSATLSNTAAGYTTFGGRYQFAAVAGGATDYALFVFQCPAGYQLSINNITITAMNTGAIGAITATILDWSIAVNSSAVSLATIDAATTWAPRRIPLGMQSFLVGAAIGQASTDITRSFPAPLIVDSSRYLHVIMQIPVGTATISQVIRGDVLINGILK